MKLPKALKYLIWPGLMLVTAGIVVGVLNGWTPVAVALLVSGGLLLVASVAAGDYRGFWQRRSTQAGTNAAVSVLSVLVILGLVNFLGARYDSRMDLTEGQRLSLSPASQAVVQNLEQPTEVLIFSGVPNPTDQQLLENYRRLNPDFTYRYIDPFTELQLVQQIGVQTEGEVFLSVGEGSEAERTLLVQRLSPQETLDESQLTNKLAQLSQEDTAVAYFLQGHGEYAIDGSEQGFFEAANRLRDENYTVEPLNLANTGAVPADADVLVVGGPKQALFDKEVAAVEDYLDADGSVLILLDPQVKSGLEGLMSQWGVVPEETLVVDSSSQLVGLDPTTPLVEDYGDHPITADFEAGRSFFPEARSLQVREVSNVKETPLLFTNPRSYTQPIATGELTVDPNEIVEGPFAIGVALSRPALEADAKQPNKPTSEAAVAAETDSAEAPSETAPALADQPETDLPAEESRMVVIGNASFALDGLFNQQLNGDIFLNSVNWLSKLDNLTLSIRPKEPTNRRFNLTITQQILLMLLALVVFPLLGLVGAGTLWARRR